VVWSGSLQVCVCVFLFVCVCVCISYLQVELYSAGHSGDEEEGGVVCYVGVVHSLCVCMCVCVCVGGGGGVGV